MKSLREKKNAQNTKLKDENICKRKSKLLQLSNTEKHQQPKKLKGWKSKHFKRKEWTQLQNPKKFYLSNQSK